MCRVIAIANQKGGVGKTTTTEHLGVGLARAGKRVLLIDADAQGSLTACLGYEKPDSMDDTLASIMEKIIHEEEPESGEAILRHEEGVDLMPGNIELAGMEVTLVSVMQREFVLREYTESVRENYDYILIDCMPALSLLTVNCLAAADSVIIPVQPAYLSTKGLGQLLRTINKVRNKLNPLLKIDGILLTMVNGRTRCAKETIVGIAEGYKNQVRIYESSIPQSVRAVETTALGVSIFKYDPGCKVANAYQMFAKEVLAG